MGPDRTNAYPFFWARTNIAIPHYEQFDFMVNNMKLSERQRKTLSNVKLNYGQLCNKRTLDSLTKKGLIQWHTSSRWILTELGSKELNKITQ